VRPAWILLSAVLCVPAGAIAQEKPGESPAGSKVDFAGITARGRALYAYDQAAWRGTDAIFALKPDTKGLAHYICTETPSGWVVVFPMWNAAHDQLVVMYEAREKDGKFVARKLDEPAPADSEQVAKERALELAIAEFPKPNRPYNTAILPRPDGNFFVYLYPGQTRKNVWPIGGDLRYVISADGKTVVERRRLHNAILDMETRTSQKGGYHTHAITDVPEDTDVLYVLNRRPSMPEFVGTAKQIFEIDKDGNIGISQK
jgi:hypothetical protein